MMQTEENNSPMTFDYDILPHAIIRLTGLIILADAPGMWDWRRLYLRGLLFLKGLAILQKEADLAWPCSISTSRPGFCSSPSPSLCS
jgi:hypothetical protein